MYKFEITIELFKRKSRQFAIRMMGTLKKLVLIMRYKTKIIYVIIIVPILAYASESRAEIEREREEQL